MSNDEENDQDGRTDPEESLPRPSDRDGGVASLDDVLDALADPHRRYVLHYLRDREVASVDELAREVAARERDATPDEVTAEELERTSIGLAHVHLRKLADLHLVEYDRRSSTVRYSDPPLRLEAVLRLLRQLEEGGE